MKRILTIFFAVLLASCQKAKFSNTLPVLPKENFSTSSIRFFNLFGAPFDISINNIPLTTFDALNTTPPAAASIIPGFSQGFWPDQTSFAVPTLFLNKSGGALFHIVSRSIGQFTQTAFSNTSVNLTIYLSSNPLAPKDYYILPGGKIDSIPRSLIGPSTPSNFKIRIINLSPSIDSQQLTGPVTLTYANGTPVDANNLSNVTVGKIGQYAEVPYGAYEFKMLVNNDYKRKLTQAAGGLPFVKFGEFSQKLPKEAVFPPLITFKPGGVYSIVVAPAIFSFTSGDSKDLVFINAYRIIQENAPTPNVSFSQLQFVNVLPGSALQFNVDGSPMDTVLRYRGVSGVKNIIQGVHTIAAYGSNGVLVASRSYVLSPYDYVTVWVYRRNGTPEMIFSNNDMSLSNYL